LFLINKHKFLIKLSALIKQTVLVIFQTQLAIIFIFATNCRAQSFSPVEEYPAKAALLYNFSKFVTWPQNSFKNKDSPFIIGILGEKDFANTLKTISNKFIFGRPIKIRQFQTISDFEPCQILFTNSDLLRRFSQINPGLLEKLSVLTVGQDKNFLKMNGILLIAVVKDHLEFKINLNSSRRANIEIRANLLNLASEIYGK
jgi:hypothetical protein